MSSRAASPTRGESGDDRGESCAVADFADSETTTSRSSCKAGTGRSAPAAETLADKLGEFRSARNGGDKDGWPVSIPSMEASSNGAKSVVPPPSIRALRSSEGEMDGA